MPALTVLGQRLHFVAGDDLRVVAKVSFYVLAVEFVLLWPALAVLVQGHRERERCYQNDKFAYVWAFWILSAITVGISSGLEGRIFQIASRGSPIETEKRKALPILCVMKLIPLSLLRFCTVYMAVGSLFWMEDFCAPELILSTECRLHKETEICVEGTRTAFFILAVVTIVETAITTIFTLVLLCRGACVRGRKRHQQAQQWLNFHRFFRGSGSGERGSESFAWFHFCQCCCIVTRCCTCGLIGGSEIVRKSLGLRNIEGGSTPSYLSDVSLLLADFFNTGNSESGTALDVTPSDILVGLNVLASEQRIQKKHRWRRMLEVNSTQMEQSEIVAAPADEEMGTSISLKCLATGFFSINESNSGDLNASTEATYSKLDQSVSIEHIQLCRSNSVELAHFEVFHRNVLSDKIASHHQIIEDGAHYMRLALAIYGHLMYIKTNTFSALYCLLEGLLTCRTCQCLTGTYHSTTNGDNHCRLNEMAFLRVANLDIDDVIFSSFTSSVEMCPFAVVIDRAKLSVVVVIQGTLSLEAAVTDLNLQPVLMSDYSDICEELGQPSLAGEYCHTGMLKVAMGIYSVLEKEKSILDKLLLAEQAPCRGWELICTGHSLGAGVAAILGLMLRRRFTKLRCLCFAPPGCVLSDNASSQDFFTSYVLDVDIVPRLSLHSMEGLRDDILRIIARIKVPKHEAFRQARQKEGAQNRKSNLQLLTPLDNIAHRRESIPKSLFLEQVLNFQRHQSKLKMERKLTDVNLFIPGKKIVHMVQNLDTKSSFLSRITRKRVSAYVPIWADRTDFAEIQISRSLISSHFPEKYFLNLVSIAKSFDSNGAE